jgi:hypothetical protein
MARIATDTGNGKKVHSEKKTRAKERHSKKREAEPNENERA